MTVYLSNYGKEMITAYYDEISESQREWIKSRTPEQLAQLFRHAADLIEDYGWVQRELGSVGQGFCVIGAVSQSLVDSHHLIPIPRHFDTASLALDISFRFARWLKESFNEGNGSTGRWNDDPNRTKEEVLLYLRKFADELAPPSPVVHQKERVFI